MIITHTDYELQKENFQEFKESALDRLELLYHFSPLDAIKNTEPIIAFTENHVIIQNLVLITYNNVIISPVVAIRDLTTFEDCEIVRIVLNNIDEIKEWARYHYETLHKINNFQNKTISPENTKHAAVLEAFELSITADIIENNITGSTYPLFDDYSIKIVSYGTSRQFNVNVELLKGDQLVLEESIPKADLVPRLSFIISEL